MTREAKILINTDMKDVKEQYRQALNHLKTVNGCTIAWLARIGGCSTRHIQSVLSEKEKKGIGGAVGEKIANAFGMNYSDMLNLGQWIIDGHDPTLWGSVAKRERFAPETLQVQTRTRNVLTEEGIASSPTMEPAQNRETGIPENSEKLIKALEQANAALLKLNEVMLENAELVRENSQLQLELERARGKTDKGNKTATSARPGRDVAPLQPTEAQRK